MSYLSQCGGKLEGYVRWNVELAKVRGGKVWLVTWSFHDKPSSSNDGFVKEFDNVVDASVEINRLASMPEVKGVKLFEAWIHMAGRRE